MKRESRPHGALLLLGGGMLMANVLLMEGCTDAPTIPPPSEAVGGEGEMGVYGAAAADSAASVADTVYGRIPAGLLDPDDEISIAGDTIFKDDTIAVGTILDVEQEESDSTSADISADIVAPEMLEPGDCAYRIEITYDGETILIITITKLFCLDEYGDVIPGSGGGQTNYEVTLKCLPASPRRGTTVTCNLTTQGPQNALSGIYWSSSVGSGTAHDAFTWSGRAVKTTTVRVGFVMYNQSVHRTALVTVGDRGLDWEEEYQSSVGDASSPACNSWTEERYRDYWGQTTHVDCHADIINANGYKITEGSGPWEGIFFADNINVSVIIRSSLRPQLYVNGPKFRRPDTTNVVPTTVVPSGYTPLEWRDELIEECDEKLGSDVTVLTVWKLNGECAPDPNTYEWAPGAMEEHEEEHVEAIEGVVKGGRNLSGDLDVLTGDSITVADDAKDLVQAAIADMMAANQAVDHPTDVIARFWRWSYVNNAWMWYKLIKANEN